MQLIFLKTLIWTVLFLQLNITAYWTPVTLHVETSFALWYARCTVVSWVPASPTRWSCSLFPPGPVRGDEPPLSTAEKSLQGRCRNIVQSHKTVQPQLIPTQTHTHTQSKRSHPHSPHNIYLAAKLRNWWFCVWKLPPLRIHNDEELTAIKLCNFSFTMQQ